MTEVSRPQYVTSENWLTVLRDTGHDLTWLSRVTGVPRPTVYSYAQGVRGSRPDVQDRWLEKVAYALGIEYRRG